MTQNDKYKTDVLLRLQVQFAGLSHISLQTEDKPQNEVFFITDTLRHKQGQSMPTLQGRVKNPMQFLSIVRGFFETVAKGMLYKPSPKESNALNEMASLIPQQISLYPVQFYTKMFDIMNKFPEPNRAGVDPLLTIKDGVCYLEVFDKKSDRCIRLTLHKSLWHDDLVCTDGTAHINVTPYLLKSLVEVNPKDTLCVYIGPDVGDASADYLWKGDIQKSFDLDLQEVRALLVMQGTSALGIHQVDMERVDFLNVLYQLRMHKERIHTLFEEKDDASVLFSLVPNQPPRLVIQPWGLEVLGHGEVYSGKKKMDIRIAKNRRDMLLLERFLPFMNSAGFTLFEDNLHYCLDVGNDDFSCSVVFAGFSTNVWYRRLQMETMLPVFLDRMDKEDASVFSKLDSTGMITLQGTETLVQRKVLIAEILRGSALFLPSSQQFLKRSLFGKGLDMQRLSVLGSADIDARKYLASDSVHMVVAYDTEGRMEFMGSTVKEELRDGETEAFVAEPKFVLDIDGVLRKVGCTCTIWAENGENGYGGPCSHLRALWLHYCQKMEALREAKDAGVDTGPQLQEQTEFVKNKEERIISIDLRKKFLFKEKWKTPDMSIYRSSTQIYASEETLRSAYAKRCTMLSQKGFTVVE